MLSRPRPGRQPPGPRRCCATQRRTLAQLGSPAADVTPAKRTSLWLSLQLGQQPARAATAPHGSRPRRAGAAKHLVGQHARRGAGGNGAGRRGSSLSHCPRRPGSLRTSGLGGRGSSSHSRSPLRRLSQTGPPPPSLCATAAASSPRAPRTRSSSALQASLPAGAAAVRRAARKGRGGPRLHGAMLLVGGARAKSPCSRRAQDRLELNSRQPPRKAGMCR